MPSRTDRDHDSEFDDFTPTPAQLELQAVVEKNLQAIALSSGRGHKRRVPGDENEDPSTASAGNYTWHGHNLARACTPFGRIHPIIEHGVKRDLRALTGRPFTETTEQKLHLSATYDLIVEAIPGFDAQMLALGGNRRLRRLVSAQLQHGLNGARGDDTNGLKRCIADYIPDFIPKVKTQRGFFHPTTAKLLCPVHLPANDDTYERIIDQSRDDAIPVTGEDMPSFMYPDDHVYNPDDVEDGLLDNSSLYDVAQHVYQGPSAVKKGPGYKRGKAGNAALNGVTALTPRDVAYCAVQLRFLLSSQPEWNEDDGLFNYPAFFWNVVTILDSEEGKDILARFNHRVFGPTTAAKRVARAAGAGPSAFELLELQRAEKRRRKEAADAAAAIHE